MEQNSLQFSCFNKNDGVFKKAVLEVKHKTMVLVRLDKIGGEESP